jgi:hypothetical protein
MDGVADAAGAISSSVANYADTHQDGIIALALMCGTAVVFCGRTLLRPTVFMIGFIPTVAFFASIGYSLLPESSFTAPASSDIAHVLPVVVGIASVALGVLAGIIVNRLLFALATFIVTAASGVVFVLIAHAFLLQPVTSSGQVILFTAAVVAALVTGMLSLIYPRIMVILGTAFDGAAIAVLSVAHFLGNGSDAFMGTATALESPWWALGCSIATVVLGSYGVMIQMRVVANESAPQRVNRGDRDVGAYEELPADGENESLLATYGSVDADYTKSSTLGAPPLGPYDGGAENV